MNGSGSGGGDDRPPSNGGEFLLSLLQRPNHQFQPQLPTGSTLFPSPPPPRQQQQQQQPSPSLTDPAVAAMGPTLPLPHHVLWQSNMDRPDLVSPTWPHHSMPVPSTPTPNLLPPGFPQNPWPSGPQSQGNQLNQPRLLSEDLFRLGCPSVNAQPKQQESGGVQKLQFGSMTESLLGLVNPNPMVNTVQEQRVDSSSRGSFDSSTRELDRRKHQQAVRPPPGFSNKPQGGGRGGNRDYAAPHRKEFDYNLINKKLSDRNASSRSGRGLTEPLDRPGPPVGSNLHSVSALDVEESLLKLNLEGGVGEIGKEDGGVGDLDDVVEELLGSLLIEGESEEKKDKKQKRNFLDKESRSDSRGQTMLSQRMRMFKSQMRCRGDIERFNGPFLAIYESLIPLEEERAKQKQLLALLEKLVNKEWPEARLYLYGSCANSFGVSKSDIDVCLAIDEANIDKSEVLLKLANILQSDNLQNVQALTRARVPIVKLMDPVTGISCDICINNVLAVVNTKLLGDYAKIDSRLRQLAFIVKHWAKSRAVNEPYQGTLSSYAYVLMCIHFLQQRRPAILPCLQGMETTYSVTVDDVQCSFFDQVEQIRGFGSHNREMIAHLVWGFFYYWAYRHDYTNDVISVRTGSIISKREKDWTRRVGNDRHLICIEDPFETSHDLGRVVDKFSIRVLREEFERAAEIMQYDANPCVTLFEPYIP